MNRTILLNMLLVLGVGAVAMGQTTAPASDAEAAKLRATADEQVRTIHDLQAELAKLRGHPAAGYVAGRFTGPEGLAQKIDFVADAEPLEAVLVRLAKLTDLNVVADWNSIEDGRTKRDTPISVNLKGVTLEKLLDAICAPPEYLEYDFDDRRTLLISKGELFARRNLVTRFYDIRTLIAGAQGQSHNEKAARIMNDIESSVDPTSWEDQGGRAGTLFTFKGQLVVAANKHDQMTVAAYLKKQAEHQ